MISTVSRKFVFIDSSQIIGREQESRHSRIAFIAFLFALFDIVRGIAIFFLAGITSLILISRFHRYLEFKYPHLQLDLFGHPLDVFKLKKRHSIAVMLMPFAMILFTVFLFFLTVELFSWLSHTTILP